LIEIDVHGASLRFMVPPAETHNFVFLYQAGTILCCIGCAIFGITEVSTDGVAFDATDTDLESATTPSKTSVSTGQYNPPMTTSSMPQTPLGVPSPAVSTPVPSAAAAPTTPASLLSTAPVASQRVDALDSEPREQIRLVTSDELHGLD
jgi:hypothetical protein